MSLNQLLLDEQKPYLDIRVNDITLDGKLNVTSESDYVIPLTSIALTLGRTGNINYEAVRIGNIVTIKIHSFLSSDNPTNDVIFTDPIDSNIRPSSSGTQYQLCTIEDNGSISTGIIRVRGSGILELYADIAKGPFSAVGNAGLKYDFTFSYVI